MKDDPMKLVQNNTRISPHNVSYRREGLSSTTALNQRVDKKLNVVRLRLRLSRRDIRAYKFMRLINWWDLKVIYGVKMRRVLIGY